MTGAVSLVETNVSQWCAHIDGLAFGGKSAGIRKWIRARDLVVVPTVKLKEEWQAKLGLLDPLSNASVVTQHEALRHKYCSGYVIIDEAFTLDLEHLQMLANRHHLAKGVITVGDSRQISNVFSPTGMKLDPANAPACMVTPVSFAPWDVVALYLSQNSSSVACEHYFCGSAVGAGLQYTINGNDVLIPTLNDLAIQGTQNAKAAVIGRGITSCRTTHECQGARSDYTIVHSSGSILQSDMRWLAMPEQRAHLGVTITRAAKGTVFVVDGIDNLKDFEWVDIGVAGELSTTCIFSGTAWDFIDPHTQDEVNVEYLREAAVVETSLEEPVRTDPVTIGTIFNGSEALSAAEIRSNVEITPGVKFRDENEAHSDAFDKYTLQPRDIPGADKIQALTRRSLDVKPTYADHCAAHAIVDLIFEEVIDKKKFFSHISNSRRATLNRRTRQQAIDGCYATEETRMSVTSFAFLKPEFAKKESQLVDGKACEIKAQGVVSASDMQQSVFADVCDSLTHAWARSMRPGKFSPVGLHEDDIALELSTYSQSYELDIEKQDSSHRAVHVLVAGRMMAFVADRLGLDTMAEELRSSRNVRMMNSPFSFLLNWALASGDPWTLIINKIMAVSVLVSLAEVKHVRFCQSGDDITLDRRPSWRNAKGIRAQTCANRGLKWKVEERSQRANGVTFISRGVLPGREIVYKALRTILKYAHRKRSRLQHVSIKADAARIMAVSAHHGLQAYAESRCKIWGGDPVVVFDMWARALSIARMPYDRLPFELKDDKEKPLTIKSKALGCFGFALAQCVGTNVQAVNAVALYPRTTPTSTAIAACDANKVPYILVDEVWAKRSRERLQNLLADYDVKRGTIVLYRDHAVAAVPTSIITHSSHGKREIRWKNVMNKSAEIVEF
jgi:hypothetical protein